jgi:hypothetical protein
MSIFWQTATRIGYIDPAQPLLNGCTQYLFPGAAPLVEERTHMDPVGSQMDNLQNDGKFDLLKINHFEHAI